MVSILVSRCFINKPLGLCFSTVMLLLCRLLMVTHGNTSFHARQSNGNVHDNAHQSNFYLARSICCINPICTCTMSYFANPAKYMNYQLTNSLHLIQHLWMVAFCQLWLIIHEYTCTLQYIASSIQLPLTLQHLSSEPFCPWTICNETVHVHRFHCWIKYSRDVWLTVCLWQKPSSKKNGRRHNACGLSGHHHQAHSETTPRVAHVLLVEVGYWTVNEESAR